MALKNSVLNKRTHPSGNLSVEEVKWAITCIAGEDGQSPFLTLHVRRDARVPKSTCHQAFGFSPIRGLKQSFRLFYKSVRGIGYAGEYHDKEICIWKSPRFSFGCMLVPVQYREYENRLCHVWHVILDARLQVSLLKTISVDNGKDAHCTKLWI